MKLLDRFMTIIMLSIGIILLFIPDVNRFTLPSLYFACATLFSKHVKNKEE